MRISLAVLAAAVLAPALVAPSPAEARPGKRKPVPAVAVWDLQTTDLHRNDGGTWYSEIAEALAVVPDVVPDRERDFLPRFRVGEGIRVAIDTAVRRREAGWTALRGREYAEAITLVQEGLDLVSPYPDERLPEGLVRDLKLLQARVQLASGEVGIASMTLQTALALDPSWAPRRDIEHPRFLDLFDEVDARRSQAPTGVLTLRASVPDVRVLVHGTPQGMVYNGDLTLQLPPGIYRVVGRKAGYADAVEEVRIRPDDEKNLVLSLSVQNSVRFQESVSGALEAPRNQRASGVWDGFAQAVAHIDARAVLAGRFVAHADEEVGGTLHVGLYLPGRGGWGCHRVIEVTHDEVETSAEVEEAILAITGSLEAGLNPVYLALQD